MFAISNHRFPIWLPPAQLQSYWVNMMPNIFRWWNRITTLRDQACMQGANITSVFQRRHVVLPCHLIWFVFVDLQPHVVPFRLIRLAALCQHCDRHSQVSGEPTVSSMSAYCYTCLGIWLWRGISEYIWRWVCSFHFSHMMHSFQICHPITRQAGALQLVPLSWHKSGHLPTLNFAHS